MAWLSLSRKRRAFEYPSLRTKARAFRVIRLLPSGRSSFLPFREILNMEIIERDVDDVASEYDTLSYCWGAGAADREVNVVVSGDDGDGDLRRSLYISGSLEAALLSLAREPKRRPIFADQICINQRDNAEKVQQVGLMGEIYARSASTVVWIGDATPEMARYFGFVTELMSEGVFGRVMGPNAGHYIHVFDAVMDASMELATEAEREDRVDLLHLIDRFGPRFPVRGLAEILRRAWFGRVWTIQEGCLPGVVMFRCGDRSMCFDCFRGGMLFYSLWTTYWNRTHEEAVLQHEFRARDEIYTLFKPFVRLRQERRAIHGSRRRRRSLYELVVMYNVNDYGPKIGATKAEDRIYALLGLAEPDEVVEETVRRMEVDNVRGTYTGFAASVLKREVDVLLFSQMPKSSAPHGRCLPSWVPDWSTDGLRTPYGYSDITTPVFSAGGRRAGGDVAADVVADVSTGTLRVNAVSAGRVLRVGLHAIQADEHATIQNVEYMSVRRFFEELEAFMEMAVRINPVNAPDITDEQHRLESMIRLSDGGLSVRQFPTTFDSATAKQVLSEIHKDVSHWGRHLIDVEAQSRLMSSFTGMIRSVGILPWYFTPASEIDVLRSCAIDPVAAARSWTEGLYLAVSDVMHTIWYVSKVRYHLTMMKMGQRRLTKRDGHRTEDDEVLSNVGLKRSRVQSGEWDHYTTNLMKMMGRRCFVTDTGYVGLGPDSARVGDAVVVIPGGSVPHILRPGGKSETADFGDGNEGAEMWSYVGEAYCDGVMDGELVAGEGRVMSRFEIQ
ncbi:heterokaryon incompatibility protein-domain-containing protein [Xylaria sp. CBS 124048]|nr:heterokaryon incompatibility protein-domain-containing protein [Xylaria sp. CBS 124048]